MQQVWAIWEYLEVPDPNNADRSICAPCKELESKVNYAALTTALSAFLLVAFFGFSLKYMTNDGMIFQMMDTDDSGSLEVDEYIEAVRTYLNVTHDQISDQELRRIFKAFDIDGDGEIREKAFMAMWVYTGEMKRNPQRAAKSLSHEVEKW